MRFGRLGCILSYGLKIKIKYTSCYMLIIKICILRPKIFPFVLLGSIFFYLDFHLFSRTMQSPSFISM